jgi:hypothetical protein
MTGVLTGVQIALRFPIHWADPNPFLLIAPLSIPIAGYLAYRHALAVVTPSEFDMRLVALLAAQAVLIGAAVTSIVVSAAAIARGVTYEPLSLVWGFVQLILLGLVYAGIPVFIVGWTLAIMWALVLRRVCRRS